MYNQKHKAWTNKVGKTVLQIDKKTKKVIAVHDSIYAATIAIGKSKSHTGTISNVCNGKGKTAYGFIWMFGK